MVHYAQIWQPNCRNLPEPDLGHDKLFKPQKAAFLPLNYFKFLKSIKIHS